MLRALRIFNIILIDSAEITFEEGLNVITGETGSGKSAIMQSLSLIAGAKVDAGVIRKGCDKGIVEALFEISNLEVLKQLLTDAGIDFSDAEELIVRREISENGKSRGFINNQLVQIAFLKKIGEHLVDIVNQHASRYLLSLDSHRQLVDMYGNLKTDVDSFASLWSEENRLKRDLSALVNGESQRLREIAICSHELEELHQGKIKEGEEDDLFLEYSRLSASEELVERSSGILKALKSEKASILQLLHSQRDNFEKLMLLDSTLKDAYTAYQNATAELQEIGYTLTSFQGKIEANPARVNLLNDRLKCISMLKRKYGNTIEEVIAYQTAAEQKLERLSNIDIEIEDLKEKVASIASSTDAESQALTLKRQETISRFQKAIVTELKELNMPKVEFEIDLTPQKRSATGNDGIEFFLLPNVGEHRVPLKDSASGGEISRVALAFHAVLAGKEKRAILLFDEIDANIGGATASVVGKKLKEIAAKQQVICITHFPQVAKQAKIHWQISKVEINGRTSTQMLLLNPKDRKLELTRMVGGVPLF